jgi:hypothetical protein
VAALVAPDRTPPLRAFRTPAPGRKTVLAALYIQALKLSPNYRMNYPIRFRIEPTWLKGP